MSCPVCHKDCQFFQEYKRKKREGPLTAFLFLLMVAIIIIVAFHL